MICVFEALFFLLTFNRLLVWDLRSHYTVLNNGVVRIRSENKIIISNKIKQLEL